MMGTEPMMGSGHMGGFWLIPTLFLIIQVGLIVWVLIWMNSVRRALEGIRDALKDIASKKE